MKMTSLPCAIATAFTPSYREIRNYFLAWRSWLGFD